MPTTDQPAPFVAISPEALTEVAGGVTSSSSGSNAELTAMLTSIGSSIKDLAASKNNSGGGDMMNMMMMMMMMGGGGGGGAIAAPAAAVPVINVDTSVAGGGCRRGKKGW